MKKLFTFLLLINVAFAQCPPGTWGLTVNVNPDQYPEETSWYVMSFFGDTLMQGGPYNNIIDYQPQYTTSCAPIDSFYFVLEDTYGDGIAGSLWGGEDGSVYVIQCNDTIWSLDNPDFGYQIYDTIYTSGCPPPPPVFGCMDSSYVEFDITATLDTGMCYTPIVYGCTDSLAYNYVDSANTNIDIDSCLHYLELTDLAGNGWAGSRLLVSQATNLSPPLNWDSIGAYTLIDGFDTTYEINLAAGYPVRVIFEITFQSDFTAVQCGYSLYSGEYIAIEQEGGFSDPIPPFAPLIGYPYCGNTCIDRTFGCMDSTAVNYSDTVNTDDGSCYYNPGCTSSAYLEFYEQGFVADYDDNSCQTLAIWGCTDSTMYNFNPVANIDNGGCISFVYGCMDPTAFNYDPLATAADTCIAYSYGCTDPTAFNYDPSANTDNGNCIPVVFGCIDSTAFNFNPLANTDNSSCIAIVEGCTNPVALNYNAIANTDDFSCILPIYGCMDSTAFNYDELANVDNGTCIPFIYGCTNPIALNYCDTCNTDDFSCVLPIYGCTDSTMFNYNSLANIDNGSCIPFVYGCTDPNALNYNSLANIEDFSCIDYIYGCTDPTMFNYNPSANTDNGSCLPFIYGCTDVDAINYNILANTDDGTCIDVVLGCTDSTAFNYNINANTDDGSCVSVALGCTDATAFNYDAAANTDDGSCIPVLFGCIDPTMWNYCDTCNTDNGSCIEYYYGCTDSLALNYDDDANTDNGSCIYPLYGCGDPTALNYNPLVNVSDSTCEYSAGCAVGDIYTIPNPCFTWVIDIDPYCCDTDWDNTCAELYMYCQDGWSGPTDLIEFRNDIVTYPNPTSDYIYVSKKVNLTVISMLGDVVIQKDNINSLDVSKLTPGVYTIMIEYNNLKIKRKIIKTN